MFFQVAGSAGIGYDSAPSHMHATHFPLEITSHRSSSPGPAPGLQPQPDPGRWEEAHTACLAASSAVAVDVVSAAGMLGWAGWRVTDSFRGSVSKCLRGESSQPRPALLAGRTLDNTLIGTFTPPTRPQGPGLHPVGTASTRQHPVSVALLSVRPVRVKPCSSLTALGAYTGHNTRYATRASSPSLEGGRGGPHTHWTVHRPATMKAKQSNTKRGSMVAVGRSDRTVSNELITARINSSSSPSADPRHATSSATRPPASHFRNYITASHE